MTSRTITTLSLLGCGLTLLIAGGLLDNNQTLLTMGSTVMLTGAAYATGKAVANKIENREDQ